MKELRKNKNAEAFLPAVDKSASVLDEYLTYYLLNNSITTFS